MNTRDNDESARTRKYDVLISHRSDATDWVSCLARNLRSRRHPVLIIRNGPEPGRAARATTPGFGTAHHGLIIATPGAVEAGWVREEYEAMLVHCRDDPGFSVLPILLGDFSVSPFVDSVPVVTFRDPAAYGRDFHKLACRLKGRDPDGEAADDSSIEIPEPPPWVLAALGTLPAGGSGLQLIDEIFATLPRSPIVMLLAQADATRPDVLSAITTRAQGTHGENAILELTPPWSAEADLRQYFTHLARHSGFDRPISNATEWETGIDRRRSVGERLVVLVRGVENGSDAGRVELGGVLRSLTERYGAAFQVVLSGGERLAELKYGRGDMSALNQAEVVHWPELSDADIVAWYKREYPSCSLHEDTANEIREVCGGQPRVVRVCLAQHRHQPRTGAGRSAGLTEALLGFDFVWQLFTPYRDDAVARAQICEWLAQADLCTAEPWPANRLIRRLFWSNVLTIHGRRLKWRCDFLRDIGHEILLCAG